MPGPSSISKGILPSSAEQRPDDPGEEPPVEEDRQREHEPEKGPRASDPGVAPHGVTGALEPRLGQPEETVQGEVGERKAEAAAHRQADGDLVQEARGEEGCRHRRRPAYTRLERTVDAERRHLREGEVPAPAPELRQAARAQGSPEERVATGAEQTPTAREQIEDP